MAQQDADVVGAALPPGRFPLLATSADNPDMTHHVTRLQPVHFHVVLLATAVPDHPAHGQRASR